LVLLFSTGTTIASIVLFGWRSRGVSWHSSDLPFLIPLGIGFIALAYMVATKHPVMFRLSQAIRYMITPLAFFFLKGQEDIQFLLLAGLLVEACILESWPLNLGFSLGTATLAVLIHFYTVKAGYPTLAEAILMQLPMATMAFPLSILGSRYLKFREAIIDIQNENTTLENLALRLSRLNSQYQSAAISATEKGQTQERMRITRDIHDIVGYTLTNNIMLMETARDMMLENPLGIPALIESARENAEDGLTRIRAALYDLRGQENYIPDGLLAIHKLIRVFSEATGVKVGIDILMPSIALPEAADSTLYHLVQESMINSLRHGKATRIAVMLWLEAGMLAVIIRDNGIGAQKVAEGIGLSGMRERIETLGGSFSASGASGEFVVKARIPLTPPANDQPKEYIHGA